MKKISIIFASVIIILMLGTNVAQAKIIKTGAVIKNITYTDYGYSMNIITTSGDLWGLEICEGIPCDKNILNVLNKSLNRKHLYVIFDDNNTSVTDDDEPLLWNILD
ncbi:hypothetical protein [Clostridium tagluense]|uniref:Uncharacterized protein n=1 Tax=Clostridium tagluense TaxID=360422 RepID=A0A401USV8_9CLOT|nr:hypothetical protein [Clostridium tagluense]GCD12594.1 hypothetical protein Ctaglu_42170 [Clostridium tagluense]